MKTRYADIPAYITKDGSTIRELMHPSVHGNRLQSLADRWSVNVGRLCAVIHAASAGSSTVADAS